MFSCDRWPSCLSSLHRAAGLMNSRPAAVWVRVLLAGGIALIVTHLLGEFVLGQDAADMPDDEFINGPRRESYLAWLYNALGIRYVLMFLLLKLASGICFLFSVFFIVRGVSCPSTLVQAIRSHLAQNNWQAVPNLVSTNGSYLARLLNEPLQHPHITSIHAFAVLRRREEHERAKVMNCVSYLALLAILTFLTGFIGTVDGIVVSMEVISHSAVTPKPSQWAAGISMSAVTMLIGFLMSWWLALVYWILRNIYRRCVSKTNLVADDLLGLYLSAATREPAAGST